MNNYQQFLACTAYLSTVGVFVSLVFVIWGDTDFAYKCMLTYGALFFFCLVWLGMAGSKRS